MYKIQVKLNDFSAANRLSQHYNGACKNLHGHNYEVTVTIAAPQLDEFGFVVDFCKVRELFNNWIEQHWDHTVIVSEQDSALLEFVKQDQQKYFLFPNSQPPSVENLTKYAFEEFTKIIAQENPQVELLQVAIGESKGCKAIYEK